GARWRARLGGAPARSARSSCAGHAEELRVEQLRVELEERVEVVCRGALGRLRDPGAPGAREPFVELLVRTLGVGQAADAVDDALGRLGGAVAPDVEPGEPDVRPVRESVRERGLLEGGDELLVRKRERRVHVAQPIRDRTIRKWTTSRAS